MIDLRNMDNMELMKEFPDKHFDLAIVDPPYGINVNQFNMGSRKTVEPDKKDGKNWDGAIPSPEYFVELMRVSKNQIIWGGNFFGLPANKHYVIWDKGESMYGRSFSECEYAWGSIDEFPRIFKQNPMQLDRIHICQKPVKLYKWILENYAKPTDKILDTHLGSGSIAIACHYFGCDLIGSELDPDYYAAMMKRFTQETSQMSFL